MSADIVERLQQYAPLVDVQPAMAMRANLGPAARFMREAADEIARLRAEVEAMRAARLNETTTATTTMRATYAMDEGALGLGERGA